MLRQLPLLFFTIAFLSMKALTAAHAANPDDLKIVPAPQSGKIDGLTWIGATLDRSNPDKPIAIMLGTYKRSQWKLAVGKVTLPISPTGALKLRLPIRTDKVRFKISATSPSGQSQEQSFYVLRGNTKLSDSELGGAQAQQGPSANKRFFVFPGLGFTYLAYKDFINNVGATNMSEYMLTGKIGLVWVFAPPTWDVGLSAFYNIAPLAKSQEIPARFLGINFRVGFRFPWIRSPWQFKIMLGGYYLTMVVADNPATGAPYYGFRNVSGPQIFPSLSRGFRNRHQINAYFKFSPIASGLKFLSIGSNREIAAGMSYSIPIGSSYSFAITLDASDLKVLLTSTDGSTTKSGSSKTLSLGTSLNF